MLSVFESASGVRGPFCVVLAAARSGGQENAGTPGPAPQEAPRHPIRVLTRRAGARSLRGGAGSRARTAMVEPRGVSRCREARANARSRRAF